MRISFEIYSSKGWLIVDQQVCWMKSSSLFFVEYSLCHLCQISEKVWCKLVQLEKLTTLPPCYRSMFCPASKDATFAVGIHTCVLLHVFRDDFEPKRLLNVVITLGMMVTVISSWNSELIDWLIDWSIDWLILAWGLASVTSQQTFDAGAILGQCWRALAKYPANTWCFLCCKLDNCMYYATCVRQLEW